MTHEHDSVTPPPEESSDDILELGPGIITTRDERVINRNGVNYYRACDAFVRNNPGGGASYCIRQMNHEGNNHIDGSGHCTGSTTPIGDEVLFQHIPVDEVAPAVPTMEGGVEENPMVEKYFESVEQDPTSNAELNVTLSVGCKTQGEADRIMEVLRGSLGRVIDQGVAYASLSFYDYSETDPST